MKTIIALSILALIGTTIVLKANHFIRRYARETNARNTEYTYLLYIPWFKKFTRRGGHLNLATGETTPWHEWRYTEKPILQLTRWKPYRH